MAAALDVLDRRRMLGVVLNGDRRDSRNATATERRCSGDESLSALEFLAPFAIAARGRRAATTPIAARIAHALGAVDRPDERKVNRRADIPLLGGLAVALGFFVGLAVALILTGDEPRLPRPHRGPTARLADPARGRRGRRPQGALGALQAAVPGRWRPPSPSSTASASTI